jgi:hypothetical protein
MTVLATILYQKFLKQFIKTYVSMHSRFIRIHLITSQRCYISVSSSNASSYFLPWDPGHEPYEYRWPKSKHVSLRDIQQVSRLFVLVDLVNDLDQHRSELAFSLYLEGLWREQTSKYTYPTVRPFSCSLPAIELYQLCNLEFFW